MLCPGRTGRGVLDDAHPRRSAGAPGTGGTRDLGAPERPEAGTTTGLGPLLLSRLRLHDTHRLLTPNAAGRERNLLLAEQLEAISEPDIHRWETGRTRPSVDILPRLTSTLGVSIEALVHAIVETPRRNG